MNRISAITIGLKRMLKKREGVSLERHLTNPERDWRLILFTFALGIIASTGVHYVIYIKFDVPPVDILKEPPAARFLLKDELAKVVSGYKAKEANLGTLMDSRPNIVDPSK